MTHGLRYIWVIYMKKGRSKSRRRGAEQEGTKKQRSSGWAFRFSSSSPRKDERTVEATEKLSFRFLFILWTWILIFLLWIWIKPCVASWFCNLENLWTCLGFRDYSHGLILLNFISVYLIMCSLLLLIDWSPLSMFWGFRVELGRGNPKLTLGLNNVELGLNLMWN